MNFFISLLMVWSTETGYTAGCANAPALRDTFIEFHNYRKTPGLSKVHKDLHLEAIDKASSVFYDVGLICGIDQDCRPAHFLNLLYEDLDFFSEKIEELKQAADIMTGLPGGQNLAIKLQAATAQILSLNLWGKKISLKQFDCLAYSGKEAFLTDETPGMKAIEFEKLSLTPTDRAEMEKRIQKVVEDEDNSWGDTILEGPYSQIEPAKASWIEGLVYDGVIYGYHLTVSAKALYNDIPDELDCRFNEDTEEWEGDECAYGTITSHLVIDRNGKIVSQGEANFDD